MRGIGIPMITADDVLRANNTARIKLTCEVWNICIGMCVYAQVKVIEVPCV